MKQLLLLFFIFPFLLTNAQTSLTEQQIREKVDSITREGDLLFRYERAAWVSTDLAMEKPEIRKKLHGYFIYQSADTIKAIILDKDINCIYELSFLDPENPAKEIVNKRALTSRENELLNVRENILRELANGKYKVDCPENYDLNMIMLPFEKGYKFYILTGTTGNNVVPFGNDYLFITDKEGTIKSWKMFHTGILPAYTKSPKGEKIELMMHSHTRDEPFISATDICIFRLYSALYSLKEFHVYSPGLSKVFSYSVETNKVEIRNDTEPFF